MSPRYLLILIQQTNLEEEIDIGIYLGTYILLLLNILFRCRLVPMTRSMMGNF